MDKGECRRQWESLNEAMRRGTTSWREPLNRPWGGGCQRELLNKAMGRRVSRERESYWIGSGQGAAKASH